MQIDNSPSLMSNWRLLLRGLLLLSIFGAFVSVNAYAQRVPTSQATTIDWRNVQAAAKKEGRVMVYTSIANSTMNRLIGDFANANPGITLEYVRMASLPLMSRLDQERKTSTDGADVQITSELGWAEDRAKEGALSALIGPNSTAWPKAYMTRGLVPILAFDPIGIAYNTNLVKTPIANYKDLLRPEYRGQIGVLDLVATSVIAFYDWLEMTEGSGYLQKLAAQNTRVFASTPIGGQNVAAGEMPITTFVNASTVLPLIAAGAPMKLVFPRPAFALTYIGSTLGWAKRPNAALVFMDYIMSPRGQTVWTGTGEAASPLPNIPGSLDASSVNPYDQSRYTPEVARNYKVKWEAMYKK